MRSNIAVAFLVMTLLSGCGGLEVKRITGRVLVEGEPIPQVIVTFFPKDDPDAQGVIMAGVTNENGQFTELPDAKWSLGKAGNYGVILNDPRVNIGSLMVAMMTGGRRINQDGPKLIPLKYNLMDYTPLEVKLERGVNDLGEFDLADEDDTEVVKLLKNRKEPL